MKRIVFRVIGSSKVGMGHIYRALSIAEELKDHELLFLTDLESDLAISYLQMRKSWVGAFPESEIVPKLIELEPDLVIFDALDTVAKNIQALRAKDIDVLSFEDLGDGSRFTNCTINELFDAPELPGEHYRWGKEYFFIRDEFLLARPKSISPRISSLLLTFGGADQHDLSTKVFLKIRDFCIKEEILIYIVTGPGYNGLNRLENIVNGSRNVSLTHATGVISKIMERVDLAVSSNGRTVYELAHMNVPGIVIDQHAREGTHRFAREANGYIGLGLYNPGKTEEIVVTNIEELVNNYGKYEELYRNVLPHNFSKGNSKSVYEIQRLLM